MVSGETAEELGLLVCLSSVDSKRMTMEFPEICFNSVSLSAEYQIKSNLGTKGVIHAPSNQPVALRENIVSKLKEMEASGQIKKVEEPKCGSVA